MNKYLIYDLLHVSHNYFFNSETYKRIEISITSCTICTVQRANLILSHLVEQHPLLLQPYIMV